MTFFYNISTVARYEMKALFRSWFLRIFMLLALIVLFFYNLATLTNLNGAPQWKAIAVPAFLPYFTLWLLNIGQSVVAVFLASDFLKRDKKLDTAEVVYTKPVSNTEYILGKVTGNILVFLAVDTAMLLLLAVFTILSPEAEMDVIAYIQYLLLLVIPSLIFILGLTIFVMSLVRNQAVTFIVLLGYIAVVIFYLKEKVFYLFDYMAFRFPMLKSSIAGFVKLDMILIHRGIYFMLGMVFFFFSVILLKRLPNSKKEMVLAGLFGILSLAASSFLLYQYMEKVQHTRQIKEQLLSLNDKYADRGMVNILRNDIHLEHTGYSVRAISTMTVQNPFRHPLDTLIFSLNPDLEVTSVRENGNIVSYQRKLHLLLIVPVKPLSPEDTCGLEIVYRGKVNDAVCYPDVPAKDKQVTGGMLGETPVYGFITPHFVLLTPELLWYPVSGTTYSPAHAGWLKKDFTLFHLHVKTAPGLVAVSQGLTEDSTVRQDDFVPEHPLPRISLAIGEYEKRSLTADSITFHVFSVKGHAYFADALPEIHDTVADILGEKLRDYENELNMKYPFNTFSLVEVPVQFKAWQHLWTGVLETVQPAMVYLPEKGATIWQADLKGYYKRNKKWSRWKRRKRTDKEIMIDVLKNFAGVFTTEGNVQWKGGVGEADARETVNPYNIFSNFYNYRNYVASGKWPIIDKVVEVYLRSPAAGTGNTWLRRYTGLSENEKANIALQEKSFAELLPDPEKRQIVDNVISLKGELLFSVIKSRVTGEPFDDFLYDWLDNNKFRVAQFSSFSSDVRKQYNLDLDPYMKRWFYGKKLPGFLFGTPQVFRVKDGEYMKNRVVLILANPEETEGVVKITFRLSSSDESGGSNEATRLVFLARNQVKQVSYLFDEDVRSVTYFTFSSRNIPLVIRASLPKAVDRPGMAPFEGEKVIGWEAAGLIHENEIIVDNEDAGFSVTEPETEGLLFKWFTKSTTTGEKYSGFNWRAPFRWTLTTSEAFYGKYVKSAMFVRSGTGDHKALWKIQVKEAGYYDVYFYLDYRRFKMKRNRNGEYQFVIRHNTQVDKPVLNIDRSEAGWNNLGSYYFSADTAVIELNNKSKSRIVVADAVKLVK